MRRGLRAGQLFGHRPVRVIADEQIQPIAVDGHRQAVVREHDLKQRGVAMEVLGRAELQARSSELGAAVSEPGEGTAIDLDQGAAGRFGRPASSGPGRPARALGRLPELLAPAAHRLARDAQSMLLPELLGQVGVVEADLDRAQEPDHGFPYGGRQVPRGGPTPVTVREGAGAALLKPAPEPPDLPNRDSEGDGDLGVRQPPAAQGFRQPRPMQFFPAQREGLH
jgi:hypothetical protein